MQSFATTDNRDQGALDNATTPTGQASAASVLQRVFDKTAKQVEPYDADAPAAAQLHTTLGSIATSYGHLSAAARAGRSRAYDAAAATIRRDEQTLYSEVSKL
jgi:hypothetical protein